MLKVTRRRAGAIAVASMLLPRFAKAAEINWKFTSSQPATHPSTIRYMEAAEKVKQKSNGRFEITVFHPASSAPISTLSPRCASAACR